MSNGATVYERLLGPFLGRMVDYGDAHMVGLTIEYQEKPTSLKEVMCLSLRKVFDSMTLYFQLPRLRKTDKHSDPELVFEWHINWDAYAILSKARAWGCEWAEKVDTKPPGPIEM